MKGRISLNTKKLVALILSLCLALTAVGAAGNQSGYNSYFKLLLNVGTGEGGGRVFSVTIADGATGGDSSAVVNGMYTYRVPPYTEVVSSYRLFYLRYRPPVYGSSSSPVVPAEIEIGSTDNLYLNTQDHQTGDYFIQLGRVYFINGSAEVVQDFTGGVADLRWYMQC